MPCDTQPNLTPQQKDKMKDAIVRLGSALANGTASVVIGSSGAIAFKGWPNREGYSDVCAYRALSASGSPSLRRAIARAEALAGRKLDERAIAAGVHSHDQGNTWGSH